MSSGMIQHLSIAITSNDLMESIESSCTWSLFVFSLEESTISNNYVLRIPTKYRLLKVLDFEDGELSFVPGNCGNLAHLRYFSIRNIWRASFPKLLISSLLEKQHSTTRRQHRLFGDCCRIYAVTFM